MNLAKPLATILDFVFIIFPRSSVFQFLTHFSVTTLFAFFDNSPFFRRIVRVVPNILVLRTVDICKTYWRILYLTYVWKLATTNIKSRKRTPINHDPKTISRVKQRVQPHTRCKIHRACSQIFPIVHGAKQQRVVQPSLPVRQSCMTDTDSHS